MREGGLTASPPHTRRIVLLIVRGVKPIGIPVNSLDALFFMHGGAL